MQLYTGMIEYNFGLYMFLLSLYAVYAGIYARYIPNTKLCVNMNQQEFCAGHVPEYEPHTKCRNILILAHIK